MSSANVSTLEIVLDKHDQKLHELLANTENELIIVSPWIKQKAVDVVADAIRNNNVTLRLYMRFNSEDIDKGLTDLEAVKDLVNRYRRTEIRIIPNLHAKIYVSDRQRALITSGNLTSGGLRTNIETGVMIVDKHLVGGLVNNINKIFSTALCLDRSTFQQVAQEIEKEYLNNEGAKTKPLAITGLKTSISLGKRLKIDKSDDSIENIGKKLSVKVDWVDLEEDTKGSYKWEPGEHGKILLNKLGKEFNELRNVRPEVLEVAFLHSTFKNLFSMDKGVPSQERLVSLGRNILKPLFYINFHKIYGRRYKPDLIKTMAEYYSEEFIRKGEIFTMLDYKNDLLSAFTFDSGVEVPEKLIRDTNLAFLAVIYITLGFENTCKFIEKFQKKDVLLCDLYVDQDPKSVLMEVAQMFLKSTPKYEVLSSEGTDNNKTFEVAVVIKEGIYGTGKNASKKLSENSAAKAALMSDAFKSKLHIWFQRKIQAIQLEQTNSYKIPQSRYLTLKGFLEQLGIEGEEHMNILNKALTHPTWCNDHKIPTENSYSDLITPGAFLSDVYFSTLLFYCPEYSVSELETVKSNLNHLTNKFCDNLEITKYISVGKAIDVVSDKIKRDFVLSIIFVLYSCVGYSGMKKLIDRNLKKDIDEELLDESVRNTDPKSKFQDMLQKEVGVIPKDIFSITNVEGPEDSPTYTAEASFNGLVLGTGKGSSQKEAETNAAKKAIVSSVIQFKDLFPQEK